MENTKISYNDKVECLNSQYLDQFTRDDPACSPPKFDSRPTSGGFWGQNFTGKFEKNRRKVVTNLCPFEKYSRYLMSVF